MQCAKICVQLLGVTSPAERMSWLRGKAAGEGEEEASNYGPEVLVGTRNCYFPEKDEAREKLR